MSDDLDSASVRQLAQALHGLSQRIDDLSTFVAKNEKTDRFRDAVTVREIGLLTAEVKALGSKVDRSLKLNTQVVREEREVIGKGIEKIGRIAEETGKHMLLRPEQDEITGRQWRYLFAHKIGPWAVKNGVALKILGTLAAAAGAAWAYFAHLASKLHR